MAQFLRGKQAGIQNDLSAGLSGDLFTLDDYARYGINSQISVIAYDPVQSLLAVGTKESPVGNGHIYIFGQHRVCVDFTLPRKASIKTLQFCADKLISVDSKNEICMFSLEAQKLVHSYTPPGQVTALLTDPCLDYAFIGTSRGEIIAYDLDRQALAPYTLPNFWREQYPRTRVSSIVSLAFHPRDIGKILIGYSEGAAIFSIKQNKPTTFFKYEVPRGAPGGGSDAAPTHEVRYPKLTKAIWHPTGTFVLTAHEDSSLVIWDPREGRVVMARTLYDTYVDQPGSAASVGATSGTTAMKEPIFQIAWCCKENPDDTGLLIAGGLPTTQTSKGLTFMDLGVTPTYQTSSWQLLAKHFENPKRQTTLPTPPQAEVIDFCLIPRSSPHFAGACNPLAVLTLLSSGEIITLSFPSGHPISPTNMLHPSLSFVHPFVTKLNMTCLDRNKWIGLQEKRDRGPNFILGGAEARKQLKRFEGRNIVQIAHADGLIRLWDVGHDDEIENSNVLQIDLPRAVGRAENIDVTQMSIGGGNGEFSVGLRSGELVVFRWNRNQNPGRDIAPEPNEGPDRITNIMQRTDPNFREGLMPVLLLDQQKGPVTALKHSDVGFVCVGFEGGSIAILDLRGPAIIYTASVSDFAKQNKRASFRKSRSPETVTSEWPTCIEFGVMTLEGEDYSSICCFVGTNRGNFATFKILPAGNGTYSVSYVGSCLLDDRVMSITPINADSGAPASASQEAVANLARGVKVNGVVIAVTSSGCRIFKPATAKGAHKSWDEFMCDSAAVVKEEGRGYSLVGLFGDGFARAYSIPALKEIGSADLKSFLDMKRLTDAIVSPTGDVLAWVGPSEVAMLNVWGGGAQPHSSGDRLFNPEAVIPPRPTISNLQWLSGTQHVTTADMDVLIGGPNRPPSKRMLEQMRTDEQERRQSERDGRRQPTDRVPTDDQEGYWAYMQRQVQERTDNLNIVGDNMDRLEENSSGWANDVNKFVKDQKKKAVLGAIGSKFGF